ncbi:flavin reductase family protein [Herbidospora yilanensis]|uniref:flavin reductase family protein n=1 Tax=Herbidospora yilanensis TaxID=354426 RepID=UPI000785C2C4|nr:flavin reductase family protein [Herbidospora yilanensis]
MTEPGGPATPGEFRGFMRSFVTGVTVVASVDESGGLHGLTCNSLSSVSLDPPTLLVCLDVRSGTLGAVRDSGAFTVNLLGEAAQGTAELFASAEKDRFDRVTWKRTALTGLPWLVEDALAVAECRVSHAVPVGDHVVVFGRVVNIESGEGNPLLYGMGRFAAAERPTVPVSRA